MDCLREPGLIAFAKSFGASVAILGAAAAWLLNNALRWLVWFVGERRREYELIKGLKAEIGSNAESEQNWSGAAAANALIERLRTQVGPYKPWVPYVAVVESNAVFDGAKDSINRLPAFVIEKVVEYYNFTTGLTAQLHDLRSEAYAKLSHARQITVLRNLYDLGEKVVSAGGQAQDALPRRLTALQTLYGVGVAVLALAVFIGAPALVGAAKAFVAEALTPAVEWASA